MSVRGWLGGALASLGILVIGWQAGESALATSTVASTTPVAAGSGTGAASGSGSGSSGSSGSSSSGTSSSTGSSAASGTGSSAGSGSGSSSSSSTSTSTGSSSDGTWTGDTVRTAWGPMQVQVTISGGQITDVTALQITGPERRSVQISNAAVPMLRQEVLSAQSANVSMIGGATYTSAGYLRSLQSALDQAGF